MIDPSMYSPGGLTVPAGTTILWHNAGRLMHTLTAKRDLVARTFQAPAALPAGAEPFGPGDLGPGQTWASTFEQPGQSVYFCRYHVAEQMVAVVEVTGAP